MHSCNNRCSCCSAGPAGGPQAYQRLRPPGRPCCRHRRCCSVHGRAAARCTNNRPCLRLLCLCSSAAVAASADRGAATHCWEPSAGGGGAGAARDRRSGPDGLSCPKHTRVLASKLTHIHARSCPPAHAHSCKCKYPHAHAHCRTHAKIKYYLKNECNGFDGHFLQWLTMQSPPSSHSRLLLWLVIADDRDHETVNEMLLACCSCSAAALLPDHCQLLDTIAQHAELSKFQRNCCA